MSKIAFDRAASEWNEALPIGNGFMGAMVFGGALHERIQLNEDSLWSGGPMDRINDDSREHLDEVRALLNEGKVNEAEYLASRTMFATYPHMRHYQTLGDVWIDFSDAHAKKHLVDSGGGMCYVATEEPEPLGYRRELDLACGRGTVDIAYANGMHELREFFASAPANVLAYRIEREGSPLSFELSVTRKDNRHGKGSSYCDGIEAVNGNTVRLWGAQGGSDGIGFELQVRVIPQGGKVYSLGSHLIVEGARVATVYITARTTFRSAAPASWCQTMLDAAVAKGYAALRDAAEVDYRALFDSCVLELGEARFDGETSTTAALLEAARKGEASPELVKTYFDFGRYLLISSSRAHSLPANLQGIWNEEFEPAWGSKYTININTEMNYWMAEATGLSELHMPLMEHIERMVPRGREVARRMYGARGFVCHHNTDIWGDCAPQDAHTSATIWPMGGAWLCLHIVEHYRYTRDGAFLQEYLPVLDECARFFADYMVKDADGHWVTGPSASPENTYDAGEAGIANLCMGPAMDTEILHEFFAGYLELSDEGARAGLERDADLTAVVRERLDGLAPIGIGSHGQIQEWLCDYDEPEPGHRHVSQLFALYPGSQIREDGTPELAAAARRTLERRLAHGGGHTGWSKAWITLLWDRLGDAESAWENLNGLLANSTLPNLLDNHPPFQIDGNFGGATAILEMLVRDYGDDVRLLSALPRELSCGKIRGVRLRAGAVLDLSWRDGALTAARLRGLRDGTVAVRYGSHRKTVRFTCGQTIDLAWN